MALDIEAKRSVTICAGVSQSGKTTFALRYLLNAELTARFLFDPEGEYAQRLHIIAARDAYDLHYGLARGWCVFDPHTLFPGRVEEAFCFFCDWAFAMSENLEGAKVLVVDEVWQYCTPQAIPTELKTVCQTGRKRGLGLMVNTQEPNRLNGSLLGQVSEFVCFRMQFAPALELAEQRGFNSAELTQLADLEFISRHERGGVLRGRIAV